MSAALFLMAFLGTLVGVCSMLAVINETTGVRAWHLRRAGLLLLLAFAAVSVRGQSWGWAGWLPMGAAVWLTYASVRLAGERARAVRLFGRFVH